MPTYEYLCRTCGHQFEAVQSFSEAPLTICDECGGELRKVFAVPAISFKGSGFYATDHGRKSKPEPKEDKTKKESTTEAGSGAGPASGGSETSGGTETSKGTETARPKETAPP